MEQILYPEQVTQYLANEEDIWGCPRLFEIAELLKQGHPIKATKYMLDRICYKKRIAEDYLRSGELIRELCPDAIICSHYEILQGIPEEFLCRTVMHFHTSFNQVISNRSYTDTFNKYKDRIHSFVWLSRQTAEIAKAHRYTNSTYIYNPLFFSSDQRADPENRKVIFLGRLSEEKRVHLAIRHFKDIVEENHLTDWVFEIYGDRDLEDEIRRQTAVCPYVKCMGRTDSVRETLLSGSLLMLTSRFEGMPLTVLEANECGLPVIAYDFGESAGEVIRDGVTGIIVPQDDRDAYVQQLTRLLLMPQYRQKLAENAKEFAKAFSEESILCQRENLLAEICPGQERYHEN